MVTYTDVDVLDANRALGRRFFAEQDRLRGGPAPELCAADYQAVLGGNPPVNLAGHAGFAAAFYAGFPDGRHDTEEVIAAPDRVVVRTVFRGTHTGTAFGIPASGRSAAVVIHAIMHVSNGRISKLFGAFDEAGMLRQIGVLPGG